MNINSSPVMSVRWLQFHISHLTPLLESWLTDKAAVQPSLKLYEPYIIWDRLCFTQKQFCALVKETVSGGCKGQERWCQKPVVTYWRDRNSLSLHHCDRLRSFGARQFISPESWVAVQRNAGFTCISPANTGLSPASADTGLRINVIHPSLLRQDFPSYTSEASCRNPDVSLRVSSSQAHLSFKSRPLL